MKSAKRSLDRLLKRAHKLASLGQLERALDRLDAGLQLTPKSAILHYNRGVLLRALGRKDASFIALQESRQLNPSWLEPVLAIAELSLEQPIATEEKLTELSRTLANPSWSSDSRANHLRGRLAEQQNDLCAAEMHYRVASEQNPPLPLAHQHLAYLLLTQERWSEAQTILEELLNKQPNRADLLSNLSITLLRQNKLQEALQIAELALAAVQGNEDRASVLVNLGSILQELGRRDRAREHYEEALSLEPYQANALLNLGVLDFQQRDLEGAEWHYRQALLIRPDDPRTRVNLAGVLLMQGRSQEGWQNYEARLNGNSELLQRPEELPLWQGYPLSGDLLLVHEQGLGDTFQFIRYARLLQEQGICCQFQGPAKLHSLLMRSGLVNHCSSDGETPHSDVEAWIPLLSLPRLIKINPSAQPYLQANPRLVKRWQQKLGPATGLRLALHWQGQPEHEFTVSRGRSFPLSTLKSLLSIPELELISLQKGPGSEQAQQPPFKGRWHPQQALIDTVWDFEDAAAIVSCCDGLVSSDSGLAHLAGALGCRVWLLLPWLAEWRWGLEGNITPWYTNHSLLRQHQEGDWSDPVDQLLNELCGLKQD